MKAVRRYIERHHANYGVALFIVPAFLIVLAVISVGYGLAWLFR